MPKDRCNRATGATAMTLKQKKRNRFLKAPDGLKADTGNLKTRDALEAARTAWNATTWPAAGTSEHEELLLAEAKDSSAIEGVFGTWPVWRHAQGIKELMREPSSLESMLKTHGVIMEGQEHAQPGRLRAVNVRVGNHIGPLHTEVPELMGNLYRYIGESEDDPLLKAVYAHLQFETVHPFADGNGRTGRALINQILGAPAPLSIYLYQFRPYYYRALDSGEWDEFAQYMLEGLRLICRYAAEPPSGTGTAGWKEDPADLIRDYTNLQKDVNRLRTINPDP